MEEGEWWKYYRDNPNKLMLDYPEYKEQVYGIFCFDNRLEIIDFVKCWNEKGFDSSYWLDYDLWLINKAFEDVVR